jgi:signal transduction histidine kinase
VAALPLSARQRDSPWRRLPRPRRLTSQQAEWRHSLLCLVALGHVPLVVALALAAHRGLEGLVGLLPVLAMLAIGVGPLPARSRALATTGALLLSSWALQITLPHEQELHGHLFVVVALVTLYQDWAVFGLAVVAAAAEPFALRLILNEGQLESRSPAHALVTALLVAVEAGALAIYWRADAQAKAGEEQLQLALWEGQASVRARLEETERIRTDLIGTVSHEFRTPLTGIRGAALTLLKRGDRLDDTGRKQLLQAVLDQQERLSRLLENMLTAARATSADPAAVAEVDAVATEVVMLACAARPQSPSIAIVVEADTVARIDRHALHQVLANLVDNAQQHGVPGSVPLLAGGQDGREVWIAVSNEGSLHDVETARTLFEPFTQGDPGATRQQEGLGMGLYVVRRLVEVYGGWVNVRAEGGWVTVEVRLDAADANRATAQPPAAPTALPIRKVTSAAAPPSIS